MRRLAFVLMATLAGSALGGETFTLKHDKSGRVLGPFTFEDGAKIKIGEAGFTIQKKTKGASFETLSKVIIPSVEFRSVNIVDAIKFVEHSIIQAGTQDISLVYVPAKKKPKADADPFSFDGDHFVSGAPTVTVSMRQIPASKVLEALGELTQSQVIFEEKTVKIKASAK